MDIKVKVKNTDGTERVLEEFIIQQVKCAANGKPYLLVYENDRDFEDGQELRDVNIYIE